LEDYTIYFWRNILMAKPFYKRWWFWVLAALLIIIIAASTSNKNPAGNKQGTVPGTTQGTAPATTASANKAAAFKIGDTAEAGGVAFTVNSVRESSGTEFIKPKEGSIYYLVDTTVENKSNAAKNVSSILMFKLVDSEGYSYNITIGPETKGQVDGEVAPARKLRGELAFEIPKTAKGLELEIDPSIWSAGKIIFKLDR
jgi:hypothetical protein